MKRRTRFLLHTLLPPLLGAIFMTGAWAFLGGLQTQSRIILRLVDLLGFLTLYAYVFATIPSLIYAALMEVGYRCGLAPDRVGALMLSSILGLLTGSIPWIASLIGGTVGLSIQDSLQLSAWSAAGLLTGLIVELIVAWRMRGTRAANLTAPSSAP
jgi:hypothetical protein